MQYYPLQRKWKHVRPHLSNPRVADVLVEDMHKFFYGTYGKTYTHGMTPHSTESCTWWLDYYDEMRGHLPHYFQYARHSACHWLCNFELELAQLVAPKSPWRIITKRHRDRSYDHSAVWDGSGLIFNFSWCAMDHVNRYFETESLVTADHCFRNAYGRELKPGQHLLTCFAEHYSVQQPPTAASRSTGLSDRTGLDPA